MKRSTTIAVVILATGALALVAWIGWLLCAFQKHNVLTGHAIAIARQMAGNPDPAFGEIASQIKREQQIPIDPSDWVVAGNRGTESTAIWLHSRDAVFGDHCVIRRDSWIVWLPAADLQAELERQQLQSAIERIQAPEVKAPDVAAPPPPPQP